MNRILITLLFIAIALGGGLIIGFTNLPGEWYQSLAKPPFNPPNWIFGPVWSVLYVIIGFVGARTFMDFGRTAAMRLWAAQMVFNFAWSPLFFGRQDMTSALIVIIALLITIISFMVVSRKQDRLSTLLFLPYLAWVSFATLLNASLLYLN